MWNTLRRWRTWIVNAFAFIIVALPDIINALLGFSWGTVVDQKYMPYVTIAIIVVNVLMRPRPAVLPTDPEVTGQER